MRMWVPSVPLVLWLSALLFSSAVWAQQPSAREERQPLDIPTRELPAATIPEFQFQQQRNWIVFGRVMTLQVRPISGAKVRVNISAAAQAPRTLQTNLQGEFRTEYGLDAKLYTKLSVEVEATKAGYREARETADFVVETGTREIILVLRPKDDDFDVLPSATLIASLAPRFRAPGGEGWLPVARKEEYLQGVAQLLDKHKPARAARALSKAVSREPDCVGCRTLLSLALLDAGSWFSAQRQLAEAIQRGTPEKPGTVRPEPFFILGVLETWRHETKRATGFLLKAREIQPTDPLVLQELGRALVLQQNWSAAERYLGEAIKLGASPEARLLRARALLELGEEGAAEQAQAEMKAYLAGRQPKELPCAPGRYTSNSESGSN